VYHAVRGTLVGELGVEPGPELRTLHHLILTADPALDVRRMPTTAEPPGAPPRARLRSPSPTSSRPGMP
jgi:hypothetical protein